MEDAGGLFDEGGFFEVMDDDKFFIFGLGVHAVIGFDFGVGEDGVLGVIDVLFPKRLHLIKYNYYILSSIPLILYLSNIHLSFTKVLSSVTSDLAARYLPSSYCYSKKSDPSAPTPPVLPSPPSQTTLSTGHIPMTPAPLSTESHSIHITSPPLLCRNLHLLSIY